MHEIELTVNGETRTGTIEARTTLADFLRDHLDLTGTHIGCEHGVCGACTVLVDGDAVRSCLVLAVQCDDQTVTTIEGVAPSPGELGPVQRAFMEHHGLQCGFCTPGFVMTTIAVLEADPDATDDELREALSGNLCRCTGYQGIMAAVAQARDEARR